MLGYFKAVNKIFLPKRFYNYDFIYVANKLDIDINNEDIKNYNRKTVSRHKKIILNGLGYSSFQRISRL